MSIILTFEPKFFNLLELYLFFPIMFCVYSIFIASILRAFIALKRTSGFESQNIDNRQLEKSNEFTETEKKLQIGNLNKKLFELHKQLMLDPF